MADFIQPSLGPLQPNLDDYMDTFEPLQGSIWINNKTVYKLIFILEFIAGKLPTVPEEQSNDYKQQGTQNWFCSDLDLFQSTSSMPVSI